MILIIYQIDSVTIKTNQKIKIINPIQILNYYIVNLKLMWHYMSIISQ